MPCQYTIDGTTYSLPEFKAFLVDGGLDRLFPDGKYPFVVPGVDGIRSAKLPEKTTIDGKERWTVNSNGQPIAQDEQGIRNFYKWFGDSKVVDDQGRPLVVYHGTNADFEAFDADKLGDETISNASSDGLAATSLLGFWFNTEPMVGKKHSPYSKDMAVYLKIEEPIEHGEVSLLADDIEGYLHDDLEENYDNDKYHYLKDAAEAYKNKFGADGVIIEKDEEFGGTSYIAFNQNQIKSATDNTGAFDGTNPDIRYSKSSKTSGISTNNLQKMVDRIAGEHKGLPTVHVLNSASDAPAALRDEIARQGATDTVEGAMHGGEIYLFADNLSSIERAEFVLAEHEVTHVGLRGILGDALPAEMNKLYRDNARIRKLATKYQKQSPVSNAVAVEEVLADMTAEELAGLKGWRGFVAKIADWFRSHGFGRVADMLSSQQAESDRYAAELVKRARKHVRGGQEIPYNLETMLSTGNPIQKAKAKLNALRLSPEVIDTWIYRLQDKYVDLKRIREHIEKIGGTINDLNDAYEAETRYHGRMAKRTNDFLDGELKPLLAGLRSANITVEEFEQFLHARHAPEANAEMAKRNPNQAEIDAGQQAAKDAVKDLQNQLSAARKNGSATKAIEDALRIAEQEQAKWRGAQAFKGTESERLALSGMSDAEAHSIIDGLEPSKRKQMDQLAEKVDAINNNTLSLLERYGLMSRESLDSWRKAYQYYVPLHRDEAHPDSASHPIGQGFSTRGDAARQRTGSTAKVTHILSHIAMQRETAITRGEKNNVMKSLYLMVRQNPLPGFWSTEIPKQSYIDSQTGFVRTGVDPLYKQRPNVLMLRVAGKDMAIVFNEHNPQAMRLAAALKNLDVDQLHVIFAAAAPFTRYFASISTQFNPIFGLVNLIRDSQTAVLNIESTALAGAQKQVGQEAWSLFKAVSKNGFRMPSEGPWAATYDDFQNVGGQTGYRDLYLTAADRAKAIDKQIKRLELDWEKARQDGKYSKAAHDGVLQLWNMGHDWLSDYNEAFENIMRVAAYKVAVERGMSKQKAAVLAKDLTTNFNRKGQLSRDIGSMYAFFNASVQGTARIYKTLKSPTGQKIIAGGIAIGAMNALIGFLVMGGGDGDDDEWSKIPEFVKERSLIIPLSHDQYATIPMPLGFHVLHNAGRIFMEGLLGGPQYQKDPVERMLTILADAMNPLGGGNNLVLTVMPTVADPLAALGTNKDAFGKRIYKEDLSESDPTPGFKRTRSTTSDFWKWLARGINSATGGDDYAPGDWTPTPEQLSYFVGQLTGGVGREVIKATDTLSAIVTNDELPAYKVPLASRFYGNTRGQAGQADEYYENLRESNIIENGLKGRISEGKDTAEFEEKNPRAWDIAIEGNVANKRVTKLRKRLDRLKATDAPKDEINSVNDEITQVMKEFNKTMREIKAVE